MTKRELKGFKLFPRNLTARADVVVRGNSVTTRPETGVENCFPGLEFDQRNLDKTFFPGLLFELHHDAGVVLRDFTNPGPASEFIQPDEIVRGVYMAYLQGVFASRIPGVEPKQRIIRFAPPAGLESWRFIRDMEHGPIAVVLCDGDAFSAVGSGALEVSTVRNWLRTRKNRSIPVPTVGRFVLLFGERARFLTNDGVIDPALIEPGDLTRSLCSPWQYDFADCGCFYWAANKPDLVSSEAQPNRVLNFQRKNRSPQGDRATTADDWLLKHEGLWDGTDLTMRHVEMINRWHELPFVVDGRETDRYEPAFLKLMSKLLTRAEIVDRLKKLAPVEHALSVEYLYAYYSLALPSERPTGAGGAHDRIFTAGDEVFQVAIDEMRHLRAVNEILVELGEPCVLGRAKIIGEDFDGTGRAFNHPFTLAPLTRAHLDWFIEVEAASQTHDENTIDGMYTLLLRSIEASNEFDDHQKIRLSHLIKVIVDEGIDHYTRFSRAKSALAGIPETKYLKVPVKGQPKLLPKNNPDRILQDTLDAAYFVVLRSLDFVFQLGDKQRGAMMESARRAMFNMDDAARSLSDRGYGAMFDHTRFGLVRPIAARRARALSVESRRKSRVSSAAAVGEPLRAVLKRLRTNSSGKLKKLANRMDVQLTAMTREFEVAAMDVES